MGNYLINSEEITINSDNHICFINFSAINSKNAISINMASLLNKILLINPKTKKTYFEDFLVLNKNVLVVVRSHIKNIFSSGGNLQDLSIAHKDENESYGNTIREFCKLLTSISIPSLAIISGAAYGGGVELALAPDFRWSIGKNTQFHFIQTKLSVPGGWGGMTRLSELCPNLYPKKVSTLFLTQEVFSFEDLCRYSLIDKVFSNDEDCYLHLSKWRENLLSCEENLKSDLLFRGKIKHKELEEYDSYLFKKYFLSKQHKEKIREFISNKKIKKQ